MQPVSPGNSDSRHLSAQNAKWGDMGKEKTYLGWREAAARHVSASDGEDMMRCRSKLLSSTECNGEVLEKSSHSDRLSNRRVIDVARKCRDRGCRAEDCFWVQCTVSFKRKRLNFMADCSTSWSSCCAKANCSICRGQPRNDCCGPVQLCWLQPRSEAATSCTAIPELTV